MIHSYPIFIVTVLAELHSLPNIIQLQTGEQCFRGDSFDDWLGGSYWRTMSKASQFSARLHDHVDVSVTLAIEELTLESHHLCKRCTWAVALCLDKSDKDALRDSSKRDPLVTLAFLPRGTAGEAPRASCDPIAGSCGPIIRLTFEAAREVEQTRKLYRRMLTQTLRRQLE